MITNADGHAMTGARGERRLCGSGSGPASYLTGPDPKDRGAIHDGVSGLPEKYFVVPQMRCAQEIHLDMRRWLSGFGLLAAAAVVVALVSFRAVSSPNEAKELPVYWDLPSFSFTDQLGRTVASDHLRGKVIVANFF